MSRPCGFLIRSHVEVRIFWSRCSRQLTFTAYGNVLYQPKMTFLVQLLDVCVLSAYKVALNQRLLLEENMGNVETVRLFAVLWT